MLGMIYMIIGVALGIGTAFFCVWCYRRGISDGMAIANKTEPKPMIQKTEKPVEHEPTPLEKLTEEYLNYDPTKYLGGDK